MDVAAGAVGSAVFVASTAKTGALPLPLLCALGSAVLAVYNLDHYLDSFQIDPRSTPRRFGYRVHRSKLVVVGLAGLLGAGASLRFLPREAWIPGIALAGYQGLYFAGLKLGMRGVAKRIAASIGWSAGICLPAWIASPGATRELVLSGILFASIAWINVQSYAMVESRSENESGAAPGLVLRGVAICSASTLVLWGAWTHPAESFRSIALLAVVAVQILLTRAPVRWVHPLGEWSLALLGLVAFAK